MANIPTDDTGLDGIPSPDQVEAQQQQDFDRSQGAYGPVTSAQQIFGGAVRAGQSLFGNPRLDQARTTQEAVSNAISDSDAAAPEDEAGLDAALRRYKATYAAVADKFPQAGLQISNKIAVLENAKAQQSKLLTQSDLESQQTQNANNKDMLDLAQKGVRIVGNAQSGQEYGAVRMFDENGKYRPQWQQEVAQLKQQSNDPQAQDVQQDQWFNNKLAQIQVRGQLAQQRAALAAQAKQTANGELSDGAVARLAVFHLFQGPSALARMDAGTRKQVLNFEADHDLDPTDGVAAAGEIKNMNAALTASGRREGNIAILQNSMQGMGEQVLSTLQSVQRTNLAPLNTLIASGKKAFSDPGEAAYAGAVQSFVNEYARVVGGGNAQSTDAARGEAYSLLNTSMGPDAVRAAVKQLAQKETAIIANAGDASREILANPAKYPALQKIQKAAGINTAASAYSRPDVLPQGGDSDAAAGPPSPGTQPGPTPAMPDAALNKGRVLVNNKTGERYVSDGHDWIPARRGGASGSY